MLILGIDPGLERMGYGLIRRDGSSLTAIAYGIWHSPPGELGGRLALLADQVEAFLGEHAPVAAATERLYFKQNTTTGLDVAKAQGVALMTCARHGLEAAELSPNEVKKAVCGVGNADKKQVQFMVTRLLGLKETPKPDDAADALAVAIAHALRLPPQR